MVRVLGRCTNPDLQFIRVNRTGLGFVLHFVTMNEVGVDLSLEFKEAFSLFDKGRASFYDALQRVLHPRF